MFRILFLFAIFILYGLGTNYSHAGKKVTQQSSYKFHPTASKNLIRVRMKSREYDFPKNYIVFQRKPKFEPDALLLTALLPDLEARTKENWDEFMTVPGHGRRVSILINLLYAPEETILQKYFKTHTSLHGPFEVRKKVDGLIHLFPKPPSKRKMQSRKEVFVYPSTNSINILIECSKKGDVPLPGCRQYFPINNLILKVSYSRNFLSQWRSIWKSVSGLIRESERKAQREGN